jgi:hypothetical protein
MDDPPPPPPPNAYGRVKLSPFWSNNPVTWFAMAEGQFILNNIVEQHIKYYLVLNALPESSVALVADLVEGILPADAYDQLRLRLMDAHHLNDYQKVEQLHSAAALGAQKPSEMLAEMLRLCPRGHEASPFFTYLFLHRLPRQLRVLLATEDHNDRRALAARADQLWVHNKRNVNDTIAAVSGYEDEGAVAAVRHQPSIAKKKQPPFKKAGNGGAKRLSPEDQTAMDESGLCWYHFSFADGARTCRKPCTWQGN